MSKTLDFSGPLVDLKTRKPITRQISSGEIEEILKADLLAESLLNSQDKDYQKYAYWAIELYQKQVLSLDKVDYVKLKKFIEDHSGFTVITKYQLIDVFEKADIIALAESTKPKNTTQPKPAIAE